MTTNVGDCFYSPKHGHGIIVDKFQHVLIVKKGPGRSSELEFETGVGVPEDAGVITKPCDYEIKMSLKAVAYSHHVPFNFPEFK